MVSASGNLWSQGFAYDAFGNMSLSSNSGMPLSGITPVTSQNPINAANNRLIAGTYEPRGNLTGIGGVTMAYDGESRQNYIQDSGTSISYLYDGLGQRAEKQVAAGATTIYVHDAFGNLAAEYDSVNITPACTTCYLSYDHLGSVRLVTDENNQIVAQHDFAPFGVEIPSADRTVSTGTNYFGASANLTQMFTGQETDGGTADLDYFNARHFSAYLGRFTQPDPLNAGADLTHPQSWNAYAYVLGNPLSNTDPSGMSIWDVIKGWFGGCGSDFCGGTAEASPVDTIDVGLGGVLTFPGASGGGTSGGGGKVYDNGDVFRGNFLFLSAFAPPAKTGNGTCAAQRLVSGIFGAVNLGLAAYKAQELPLVVAGLASTGAGASAAGVAAVYGTTSIFGQALTGTAQLYSAATGNYGTSAKVAQFGSVLSGPVLGLGTLVAGGSLAQAEKNANRESMFTAGTGVVDSFMKESFGMITSLADWSFTYLGMQSGSNCGSGH